MHTDVEPDALRWRERRLGVDSERHEQLEQRQQLQHQTSAIGMSYAFK